MTFLFAIVAIGLTAFFLRQWISDVTLSKNDLIELSSRLSDKKLPASEDGISLPYRLYIPKNYKKEQSFPLLVYLHGANGRGTDNLQHLDYLLARMTSSELQKSLSFFVVAPQCPPGEQWADIDLGPPPYSNYDFSKTPESSRIRSIFKILNIVAGEFNIDEKRIYIMGFSMGASGTWDTITRYPDRFAAAVTMSGVSDPKSVERIVEIPVWAFHGKFDRVSPIGNTLRTVNALTNAGGNVTLTQLYWGHGISKMVIDNLDLWRWLFKQKRAS